MKVIDKIDNDTVNFFASILKNKYTNRELITKYVIAESDFKKDLIVRALGKFPY